MVNWILALAVLVIPCYLGFVQVRELVGALRRGELKCPIRRSKRSQAEFAD